MTPYSNDADGIKALVEYAASVKPSGVVLEATGGYETLVAVELQLAGLPVSLVNPRQVRNFARATGRSAKTDVIDAHVLAQFAAVIQPAVRPLPDEETRELRGLVDRRHQLLQMLTSERNRLRTASKTGTAPDRQAYPLAQETGRGPRQRHRQDDSPISHVARSR